MIKNKAYKYIGRNGYIISEILLECEKTDMYHLIADSGKILTDGNIYTISVNVFPDELDNWKEIEDKPEDNNN